MTHHLYSLKTKITVSGPNIVGKSQTVYEIRKFDEDFNCLATYSVTDSTCTCPRGETKKPCRHTKMLHVLSPKVDTGWFLNWETRQWHQPIDPCEPITKDDYAKLGISEIVKPLLPEGDLPAGVVVIGLDDPALLHNTIAEAIGEPSRLSTEAITSSVVEGECGVAHDTQAPEAKPPIGRSAQPLQNKPKYLRR